MPDYQQAVGSLAGMMAGGMPAGQGEAEGQEMVPCPVCMGTGMVSEDVAEAMGGGMPQSLAMRVPPQLSAVPAGRAPQSAPMMMGS